MPTSSFLDLPDGTDISIGGTTSTVPKWYEAYQQGILNKGNTIAAEPYTPYTRARLANPQNNADIMGSRNMVRGNAGKGTTLIDIGGSWANNAPAEGNRLIDIGGSWANNAPAEGNRLIDIGGSWANNAPAEGNRLIDSGASYANDGGRGDSSTAAEKYFTNASGMSASSAAQPYLTAGTQAISDKVSSGLLGASERYVDNVDKYQNPYMDASVGNMSKLMSRNLTENILPGVNQTFTGAGQFGSTRHGDFTNRAIRDTQEGISRTAADMLSQSYKDNASIFAADEGRQMDATKALGSFLDADAGRNIQAGSLAASSMSQDAQLQAQMGQAAAAMYNADKNRALQAASTLGNLGQARTSGMNQTAATLGNLGQARTSGMNQTAATLGQLGQARTQSGIQDAASLEGIGNDQLNADQASLDLAYGDWQNQQNHPLKQLQIMMSLMNGQPIPGSGTTTTTAEPASRTNPLAMLLGSMAGMYGMQNRKA
jgi:hypothetical protein